MYLHVYFNDKTHVMWPKDWNITGSHFKTAVFVIILVGTTANGFALYLKYVLQCQLNIYFLQLIISKVESKTYSTENRMKPYKMLSELRNFLYSLTEAAELLGLPL